MLIFQLNLAGRGQLKARRRGWYHRLQGSGAALSSPPPALLSTDKRLAFNSRLASGTIAARDLRLPLAPAIAVCFLQRESRGGWRAIAVIEHPPPLALSILPCTVSVRHGPCSDETGGFCRVQLGKARLLECFGLLWVPSPHSYERKPLAGGGISERLVASSLSRASPGEASSGSFSAKLAADPEELPVASGVGAATTRGQRGAAPVA